MRNYKETAILPSTHESILAAIRMAGKVLRKTNFGKEKIEDLLIAVSEIVDNAITHGNNEDPRKSIRISITLSSNAFKFSVVDEGEGFETCAVKDPTLPENLIRDSGRGILVTSSAVDRIRFRMLKNGLKVEITAYESGD